MGLGTCERGDEEENEDREGSVRVWTSQQLTPGEKKVKSEIK